MYWGDVLLFIIGLAALFEGFLVVFFPKFTGNLLKGFIRRPKKAKIVGVIEIIIALFIMYWAFRSLA